MSIAFIINNLNIGGAEKLLIDKINNWPKEYDVHLILLQENNSLLDDLRKDITIHKVFSLGKLKTITKLISIYKKFNIDYSFSHLERPNKLNLISALFVKTKPIVVVHSINMYRNGSLKELETKLMLKFLAKKIVAISSAVKNYLITDLNLREKKVFLIENGIDFKRIKLEDELVKTNTKAFFTLGRLVEAKGYDFMIKALTDKTVLARKWQLTLIGDGPLYKDLLSIIEKEGLSNRITLVGSKKEPFKYVKKDSIALMPSRREGLPIALLEMLSLGIPVLSSNIKPLELIKNNVNGFKFALEDTSSFITAFKNALDINDVEYKNLSTGAKNSVNGFSIETCINKYLKLVQ